MQAWTKMMNDDDFIIVTFYSMLCVLISSTLPAVEQLGRHSTLLTARLSTGGLRHVAVAIYIGLPRRKTK